MPGESAEAVEALSRRSAAALAEPAQLLARRAENAAAAAPRPSQPAGTNATGMPDALKTGIEALSGLAMDDVRVHRGSPRPAAIGAQAFAQGNEVHLGPGEERHLPHEAWHIVQQKQGRVRPTRQLKAEGVAVNDAPGLEAEADAMGARALRLGARAERNPAGPLRSVDPASAPIQAVWVKRLDAKGGKEGTYYAPAKPGETGALDTAKMKLSERRAVRADLERRKENEALAALDKELNAIVEKIDEKEIVAIGKTLAALQAEKQKTKKLSKESEAQLDHASFRLLKSLDYLATLDETDKNALKVRLLVQHHLDLIGRIDAKAIGAAAARAEGAVDLAVSDEDVAAYRADIREQGVWGGGAEARIVATAFNFQCRVLILDGEQKYLEVGTVGRRNPRNRSLLNIGNHYEVVRDTAVAGGDYDDADIWFRPEPDGDCLFSALFDIAGNGAAAVNNVADNPRAPAPMPAQLDRGQFITRARELSSVRLTREDVSNTIVELRMSGERGGIGKRLAQRMNVQDVDAKALREALASTGKGDSELYDALKQKLASNKLVAALFEREKTLSGVIGVFAEGRKAVTKEKEESSASGKKASELGVGVGELDALLEAVRNVVAQRRPETGKMLVASVGQDPELEKKLRRESVDQLRRTGVVVTPSDKAENQYIVKKDSQAWVIDRIGQLVPRYVSRGISDFNVAELKQAQAIYPTADSPVPKSDDYAALKGKFASEATSSASGIGDNLLAASREMAHVEGEKPSPFMSTTAEASGTINPQGKTFGAQVYRIDLAYLPSSAIAALYTDRGMGYYLLSAYKGSDKAALVEKARGFQVEEKKLTDKRAQAKSAELKNKIGKFTGENANKQDATLSGKEWQALMDVVRTNEILILGRIPGEAMSQPKGDDKVLKSEAKPKAAEAKPQAKSVVKPMKLEPNRNAGQKPKSGSQAGSKKAKNKARK